MIHDDLKHIAPPVTEARLSRQYAAVRARVPLSPRRPRAWAGWAVAAAFAAALVFVLARRTGVQGPGLVDGAVVESPPSGEDAAPTSIRLADGSRVNLGASTRARFTSARPGAIRIDLERGDADIEATHVDGRTFVVGAGGYEVRVVGTRFAVHLDPGRLVSVRVDRGAVEVVAAAGGTGESRRLGAGERWSAPDAAHDSAPSPAAPPPSPVASLEPPPPLPQTAPATGTAAHHDEGAKDLFDDGQRARAEGRPSDAARAFDRLRRAYPRDPRAALAALELGRLRLDVLGDPRGAEEALRDAIALGPSSPFLEDAEARRVEALGRMGDTGRCAAARAAYLARWPQGTYRRAVELGCGDR